MPQRQFLAIIDAGCGIHVPLLSGLPSEPVQEYGPASFVSSRSLLDALEEPSRILLWLDADPAEDTR